MTRMMTVVMACDPYKNDDKDDKYDDKDGKDNYNNDKNEYKDDDKDDKDDDRGAGVCGPDKDGADALGGLLAPRQSPTIQWSATRFCACVLQYASYVLTHIYAYKHIHTNKITRKDKLTNMHTLAHRP